MHYFIDGYNLLFRLLHNEENLQNQREEVIHDLNQKISLVKIDASIVFDSTFQLGGRTRSHYHELEILFTAEGETADEYILDELKNTSHPEKETVVTSDKQLAWRARHRAAHTESVEDFILWLNRAYKNKLREQKKEKPKLGEKSDPSPQRTPLKPIPKALVPSKDAPLEVCDDYYQQIFENKWQVIQEKEKEQRQLVAHSVNSQKPPPRKPKKKKDPFAEQLSPEEKAASEMERWLKIFEYRSQD